MGVTAQLYASLGALDDLGPAAALAPIPARTRRAALRFASAHFATYVRPRYGLPLKPWVQDLDASGLEGGAAVVQEGTPTLVQDVVIRFPGAGTVGVAGLTYELSTDGGSTFAAAAPLPLSGVVTVDNVYTTVAGAVLAGDQLTYSTVVDEALCGHTCAVAAWTLLHNRGLDPAVEAELQRRFDAALAWQKDVRDGTAQLDPAHDATPDTSEEGALVTGETSAYAFLDEDSL